MSQLMFIDPSFGCLDSGGSHEIHRFCKIICVRLLCSQVLQQRGNNNGKNGRFSKFSIERVAACQLIFADLRFFFASVVVTCRRYCHSNIKLSHSLTNSLGYMSSSSRIFLSTAWRTIDSMNSNKCWYY